MRRRAGGVPAASAAAVRPGAGISGIARRWLGPALLAGAFVALARWSWGKWPDPLVDFGNQLYIAWQLADGQALYRDIQYQEGPLSQHANAFLFALFGSSLWTLVWANLAILAACCSLLYQIFAHACDRFTASLVVLVQLTVFSFSQYTGGGNYTWVCPYTPEQTHGAVLAVAMLALLGAHARRGGTLCSALAGGCLGLVFLTKAELVVPAAAAGALTLALALSAGTRAPRGEPRGRATRGPEAGGTARAVAVFLAGALVPVATFLLLLGVQMPFKDALRGVAGNWAHLGEGGVLAQRFYLVGMGLDAPAANALASLRLGLGIGAMTAAAALIAWPCGRLGRGAWPIAVLGGGGVFALLVRHPDLVPWRQVGRVLPLTTAVICAALVVACLRRRRREAGAADLVPLAGLALLALGLLGKVLLNVRISHYGFVLALPASLLLVAALAFFVPALVAARGGSAVVARALLVAPVLAGAVFHLRWSDTIYANKDFPAGPPRESIIADNPRFSPRGYALNLAYERLLALMPPGTTLAAVPDGAMLNYWLRRRNPTRHTFFTPWNIAFAGGESAVLADFRAHPPDFLVLVHRDAEEFGLGYFGSDRYGGRLLEWIRGDYRPIYGIGAEPLRDERFGIQLLARAP